MMDLTNVVLGPLAGLPEASWQQAPPGKWTPAQIVHHLAISVDGSSRVFQERRAKPPMRRRPRPLRQRLAHFVYLDIGWIPSGRRAPAVTEPAQRPDAAAVERQLRDGVARFVALARELLPARRGDLFVRHPVFGVTRYMKRLICDASLPLAGTTRSGASTLTVTLLPTVPAML